MSDAVPVPSIRRRTRTVLSPWVTLVERAVAPAEEIFHSLELADYVSVLAETRAGEIVLVEQFRPALERATLELPGGLLDPGEEPLACAARELAEETGFAVPASDLFPLGALRTDTGRLENRIWGFHARDLDPIPGWKPEPGIARHLVPKAQFLELVRSGSFDHALHVGLLALASLKGRL